MDRTCRRIGMILGLGVFGTVARGAEPPTPTSLPPAVSIRMIHPDRQCERIIALFRGTRAPHPASALAAWKRATAPRGSLGKAREAAIAAINPEMARELRVLDRAELVVAFEPEHGAMRWHAILPRDDGTFAALATALALTDGAREPPLGPVAVDRLGPPGAPLMARAPDGLAVAGSRAALVAAIGPGHARPGVEDEAGQGGASIDTGWLVRVDPEGLGRSGPIARRRLAEGLRALCCRVIEGAAGLEGETLALDVSTRLDRDAPPLPAATIDPAWFDGLPAPDVLAAFAWAIDPAATAWDRAFALADRIEKADPAASGAAPIRTRVNLLATTARVRPEVDLWPHLRGLSGVLVADPTGAVAVAAALIVLHADSPASADRIATQVLPRLGPVIGGQPGAADMKPGPRLLGRIDGRPVFVDHQGTAVRLGWGESAPSLLNEARTKPVTPIGPMLRGLGAWGETPPHRFAAFWPGRLALAQTLGAPLARSIAESPPLLWSGRNTAEGARDLIRWTGLHDLVRRFLDRLPLDPNGG